MPKSKKSPATQESTNAVEMTELNHSTESESRTDMPAREEPQKNQKAEDKPLPSLRQWVDAIMADKPTGSADKPAGSKEDFHPTITLSRFGLKTPEDVKKFLESPAGEVIIGEIGAKLSLDKAIEEEQRLEQQEHRLLMSRLKALMFLWYLDDKADAASRIQELVLEQNDHAIKNAKTPVTQPKDSPSTSARNEAAIAQYEEAIRAAQANIAEEKALNQKMSDLVAEGEEIEAKYTDYERNLDELDDFLEEGHPLKEEEINDQIAQLSSEMEKAAKIISNVLKMGHEGEARVLLEQQNGLNLKAAVLHDMLAVCRGIKCYVNENGDTSSIASSFKKAHFVIPREYKVHKDDDGVYLLKPDQDWESVKKDPAAKENAKQGFQNLKSDPISMSVRLVVGHNKQLEMKVNIEQIADTKQLLALNQKDRLTIANSITNLKPLEENAQGELIQPVLMHRPKFTPNSSSTLTPKPSQVPSTFYRKQVQNLRENQNPTYQDLHNLVDSLPLHRRESAIEYLKNLPRSGNIPFQIRQALLKNMERFGLDPTPVTTSIVTPGEGLARSNENEKTSAPSPFSMTPYPK